MGRLAQINRPEKSSNSGQSESSLKNFENRRMAPLVLLVAVSIVSGFLQGNRLPAEMGSDFGVYYLIAASAGPELPLYDLHFDHKGPVYFGFLKLLGAGLPVSVANASLVFGFSIAISSLLVGWSGFLIATRNREMLALLAVVAFTGFAVLQPSNASIAIFQCALIISSFAMTFRGVASERQAVFFFAGLLAAGAVLTRIDGFLALMGGVVILFGMLDKKRHRIRTLLAQLGTLLAGFLSGLVSLLLILMLALGFSLRAFFEQAVMVNLTTLPKLYGLDASLQIPLGILFLLTLGGLAQVTLLVGISMFRGIDSRQVVGMVLVVVSFSLLFATQSEKNYHLFIVVPALIILLLLSVESLGHRQERIPRILPTLAFLPGITLSFFHLATYEKWHEYDKIIEFSENMEAGSSFYAFNQGWPFIISGEKADLLFTPWIPSVSDDERFMEFWGDGSPYKRYDFLWLDTTTYATFSERGHGLLRGSTIVDTPFERLVVVELDN